MPTFLGEIVTSSSVLDHLVLYPGAPNLVPRASVAFPQKDSRQADILWDVLSRVA